MRFTGTDRVSAVISVVWGYIKFGHTNPLKSNSGFQTILLMTYNYFGKTSGLTSADILSDADYQRWLTGFEGAISQFGDSTGTYMEDIIAYGPSLYDIVAVYDAVQMTYEELQANGDPQHIRAIVVLSDGEDTASELTLDRLLSQVVSQSEGGTSTKIFTIAFGKDADKGVLQQIAEPTGGKQYDSDPRTINEVYADIATFF